MSASADTRTATQRIEDLEKVVTMLYNATAQNKNTLDGLVNLTGDMGLVKEALKLLNKKTEAIVQAASLTQGISPASVSELVTKMNVAELTAQVAEYVANGHIATIEAAADDSYLVCEEYDAEGKLANPRVQFRADGQDATVKDAIRGKKAGDMVLVGENKFSLKILEIYTILPPKAPEVASLAPAAPAETAPAAEATPAETQAAPEAAAPTPSVDATGPTESAVGFSLDIHGQPEASLASSST